MNDKPIFGMTGEMANVLGLIPSHQQEPPSCANGPAVSKRGTSGRMKFLSLGFLGLGSTHLWFLLESANFRFMTVHIQYDSPSDTTTHGDIGGMNMHWTGPGVTKASEEWWYDNVNTSSNSTTNISIKGNTRKDMLNTTATTRSATGGHALIYNWRLPCNSSFSGMPFFGYCTWIKTKKEPAWEIEEELRLDNDPNNEIRVVLNSTCLMKESQPGTGNWLMVFYLFRLRAAQTAPGRSNKSNFTHAFDLNIFSEDGEQGAMVTALPWLSGSFNSLKEMQFLRSYWDRKSFDIRCMMGGGSSWGGAPLMWALPIFKYEMRRMAVALIGAPPNDPAHPAHTFRDDMLATEEQLGASYQIPVNVDQPLHSNVDIDDVAIHFRCGDVMASRHSYFKFLKFSAIARWIDANSTRSIGIVTQPFKTISRIRDEKDYDYFQQNVCKDVTLAFQQYLADAFPSSKVCIRNDSDETIALAYARLVMARQSFAAPDSSFSIFPVLASFGKGYHLKPQNKNKWLTIGDLNDRERETIIIMEENITMTSGKTKKLRDHNEKSASRHIIEWFRNDTYVLPK